MTDLHWTTVQRRVKDLVPHPRNPRTITTEKMAKLKASIERFNFVEIPAIDTNGTIISGHQRLMAMQLLGRGEETVDVRLPSRPLTAKEIRDLNLTCNIPFGQNDMDMILADFEVAELTDLGFDLPLDVVEAMGEPDAAAVAGAITARVIIPPGAWLQMQDKIKNECETVFDRYGLTVEWPK